MSFVDTQVLSNASDRAKHNFPASVTSFVGRNAEIKETVTALQTPDCRLMTIIGAGGMRKAESYQQMAVAQMERLMIASQR